MSVSDEAGRFTVGRIPVGEIWISASSFDSVSRDFRIVNAMRVVSGTGTIDVGDLVAVAPRIKSGDPVGDLGLRFEALPADLPVEQREHKISAIDPAGPAARTALRVGDVITSCDGVDVVGASASSWWALARAAPGTKLTIGTRRGVTVTLVLAAR